MNINQGIWYFQKVRIPRVLNTIYFAAAMERNCHLGIRGRGQCGLERCHSWREGGLCFHPVIPELWSVSSKLDIPEITWDVRKISGMGWGRMQVCPSKGQGVPWCLVCCMSLGCSCTPAVCRVAGRGVEERGACPQVLHLGSMSPGDTGYRNGGNHNFFTNWQKGS